MDVSNTQEPISVLLAVAVRLYREGLADILGTHRDVRVAGTAATSLEAQAAVLGHSPDVIIVDVALDDALNLIRTLRGENQKTRILVFAVREDITAILDYAEAGADGFATAGSTVSELVEAINRTVAGELLCSPRIAAQLLRRAAQGRNRANEAAPLLTSREQQVFSLLKQGQSNKEISNALHIAEATVKNHVHRVLEKLHVTRRAQAATTAISTSNAGLARAAEAPLPAKRRGSLTSLNRSI